MFKNRWFSKMLGSIIMVMLVAVLLSVPVLAGSPPGDVISDPLVGELGISGNTSTQSVSLDWSTAANGTFHKDALEFDLELGESFDVWVKAVNMAGFPIYNVLFVLDGITPDQFDVTIGPLGAENLTAMDWSSNFSAFYFGGSYPEGFTMETGYAVTFHTKVTANVSGDYFFQILAVKLATEA